MQSFLETHGKQLFKEVPYCFARHRIMRMIITFAAAVSVNMGAADVRRRFDRSDYGKRDTMYRVNSEQL